MFNASSIKKYIKHIKSVSLSLNTNNLSGRFLGPKVLMNSIPKSGTNLLEQVLLLMPYMRRKLLATLVDVERNTPYVMTKINGICRVN